MLIEKDMHRRQRNSSDSPYVDCKRCVSQKSCSTLNNNSAAPMCLQYNAVINYPVVLVPTVEVGHMLRRRVACLIRRRLSLLGISGRRLQSATARKAQNSTYTRSSRLLILYFFFLVSVRPRSSNIPPECKKRTRRNTTPTLS